MAEPLKNQYGPEIPIRIGEMIGSVHASFNQSAFVEKALDAYDSLELMPRGRKIAQALRSWLPREFPTAVEILVESMGPTLEEQPTSGMAPFLYLPHAYFISDYGLDHFEASMGAQHALTQRFTAEFSIRPFLTRYPDETLAQLREWTADPSSHVRRLVSEGTRTRLPWASRLRAFQMDPSPVVELLELLKDDPELYVRRSVANNLNDIGKDHPELLLEIAERWAKDATPERMWIVRHALRSAIKKGDVGALGTLGFRQTAKILLENVEISPESPRIGESVRISFDLVSTYDKGQELLVDYCVHYRKSNGQLSPKVFKLRTLELAAGERVRLSRQVSLKEMTTRKHYPGAHQVTAQVNGETMLLGEFELRKP